METIIVGVEFAFEDWQKEKDGSSVYCDYPSLSYSDFHRGATFRGTLKLEDGSALAVLRDALEAGFEPVLAVCCILDSDLNGIAQP